VFECLINPSTRERQELVPSRAYGVKWMTSSKATIPVLIMHKSLRGRMHRRSSNLSPPMHLPQETRYKGVGNSRS
jgi:hypothetical protein